MLILNSHNNRRSDPFTDMDNAIAHGLIDDYNILNIADDYDMIQSESKEDCILSAFSNYSHSLGTKYSNALKYSSSDNNHWNIYVYYADAHAMTWVGHRYLCIRKRKNSLNNELLNG